MPEDLEKYEEMCGDVIFKVNGRTLSIDEKLFITECYLRGKSPENLGNLFAATTNDSSKEGNRHKKIFIPSEELRKPIEYQGKTYENFIDFFMQERPSYKGYVAFCSHVGNLIKDKVSLGVKTGLRDEPDIEKYETLKDIE